MNIFKTLFGIESFRIKKTCLFLPFLQKNMLKELKIGKLIRGRLYAYGENELFSVIHTGLGAPLLGDAVLYLKETGCKNIILFGSCGIVKEKKDIGIDSLLTPDRCCALESFSDMLLRGSKKDINVFYPDKKLFNTLLNKTSDIKKVSAATVGSLKLEEDYIETLDKKGIDILDMECSALFSAADKVKIKAAALFYATDIIKKTPFYRDISLKDKKKFDASIRSGISRSEERRVGKECRSRWSPYH